MHTHNTTIYQLVKNYTVLYHYHIFALLTSFVGCHGSEALPQLLYLLRSPELLYVHTTDQVPQTQQRVHFQQVNTVQKTMLGVIHILCHSLVGSVVPRGVLQNRRL